MIHLNLPQADAARLRAAHEQSDWNFLWTQALPLVKFAASRLIKGGLDLQLINDDVMSDAYLAAGAAARKWNPDLGAFSNFIIRRSTGAMLNYIRSSNAVASKGWAQSFAVEYADITPDPSAPVIEEMVASADTAEARALIDSIPDHRARRIVCLRFGIDTQHDRVYSLTEIAKEMKLARSYVHTVLTNTLKKLAMR